MYKRMEVSVKAKCMCMFRRKMYGSKNSLAFSLQFFKVFFVLKQRDNQNGKVGYFRHI